MGVEVRPLLFFSPPRKRPRGKEDKMLRSSLCCDESSFLSPFVGEPDGGTERRSSLFFFPLFRNVTAWSELKQPHARLPSFFFFYFIIAGRLILDGDADGVRCAFFFFFFLQIVGPWKSERTRASVACRASFSPLPVEV